jgi:hypothetical protein
MAVLSDIKFSGYCIFYIVCTVQMLICNVIVSTVA